jgi:signal transduction histidine kinase
MRQLLIRACRRIWRARRSLTVQFVGALVGLAFLPMAALGWVALQSIARASRETAARAYATTASATATTLSAYVDEAASNLVVFAHALSAESQLDHGLDARLRHFVIDYPQFRGLTLLGSEHRVLAASALVHPPTTLTPRPAAWQFGEVTLTTVASDEALLPTVQLIVPVSSDTPTTLVADFNLEHLWRTVHTLELPSQAQAILVDEGGRALAHSNPAHEAEVARGLDLHTHPLLRPAAGRVTTYATPDGTEWLTIAAPLPRLHWTLLIEQPTRTIDQPAITARHQLTFVLVVTLAVTALVLIVVGRALTSPLQTLTHATHALAEGERAPRVPVPAHRELANLARAFNYLVDRLAALEATVRRQEREAVIGQVGAGLLHDIAHPIRNIVNNARLLTKLPAAACRDCLQIIEREYATIDELLANLKEFSRAATPLRAQPVLPLHMLHDLARLLRHEAEERGVTLRTLDAVPLPPFMSDPAALRRILRNLTVNAIEAAQATQGTVTLIAEEAEECVSFTVSDTGPGLSSDQLATLFDAFRSTKRKGLGLGLATAKRLVEHMGGVLTVSSTVGEGTRCIVALPRRRSQEMPMLPPAASG